jgi:predicted transcriptional regulator
MMRARGREPEGHFMSTAKEEAINLITRLPEEASWDDIMYEMHLKKKIETGIKAADEGRVVPHEEVKRMFSVE